METVECIENNVQSNGHCSDSCNKNRVSVGCGQWKFS